MENLLHSFDVSGLDIFLGRTIGRLNLAANVLAMLQPPKQLWVIVKLAANFSLPIVRPRKMSSPETSKLSQVIFFPILDASLNLIIHP